MREYEIRVLSSGHATLIIEQTHINDQAAVRSARKFAGNRPFEVWRGVDCIYSPAKASPMVAGLHHGPQL